MGKKIVLYTSFTDLKFFILTEQKVLIEVSDEETPPARHSEIAFCTKSMACHIIDSQWNKIWP